MADTRKQGFYTVETNIEEMEEKIRKHRRKIAITIAVIVITVAAVAAAAGIYFSLKEYQDYEVRSEIERNDSEATQYELFGENILRYNNDGAFYADMSDRLIWNQAYEMQVPVVDICENYAVIADLQGTQIYIMNTSGVQGEIETSKPIEAVCVANQGTIAVLTQEDGTSYLELYNKSGENLASGEIHLENSGYLIDIALSNDANKLAVSILDISKGKAQTTVAFYNFDSVGQNEIDNIVASYSYADTVMPEIDFVSNDRLIAFGDTQVILFEGTQKPEEVLVHKVEKEVKSIFYDKDYYGLVYSNGESNESHTMEVYDMKGKLCLEQKFKTSYQNIELLENHEICVRDEYRCEIYTLKGVKKFSYKFDDELYRVFSGGTDRNYTFILDGVMEKVRLK